jgi:hypothetical protein
MVLTVSFELSSATGFLVTVIGAIAEAIVANLTPASGRQDHTISPSTSYTFVLSCRSVHRIPRPTFCDDRETPLEEEAGCESL